MNVFSSLRGGRAAVAVTPGPLDSDCWIWQGCVNSKGYAVRGTKDGRYLVHRRGYEQAVGHPVPDGAQLHHRCETQLCVNPAHVEPLVGIAHARQHDYISSAAVALVASGGIHRPASVAAELNQSIDAVRVALTRAARRGEIVRVRRGHYEAIAVAG